MSVRRILLWLAVCYALVPSNAASQAGLRLTYELTLRPGAREIPVALQIDGLHSDTLALELTADYGAIPDYQRKILDLRADGEPVERNDRWVVQIRTSGKDSVIVSYRIDLAGHDRSRGTTLPTVDDRHAFIPGASTFVFPSEARIGEVRVRIDKPADWNIATSWGIDKDEYRFDGTDSDDLVYSFVASGDYRVETIEFDGIGVHTAFRGQGWTRDDEVQDFLLRVLASHRDTFQTTPFERLLAVGDFFYDRGVTSGSAFHNSINLMMPRDRKLSDDVGFQNLIAHESFHLWNGGDGVLAYADYEVLWLSEGVTDFYAQKNLLRAQLIDDEEMLEEMAGKYLRLNVSFLRDMPLPDVGSQYFEDPGARSLVYTKGALAGFLIDTYLQSTTGGLESLDDVVRTLAESRNNVERGEKYRNDDVLGALETVGGAELVKLFQDFSSGDYRRALESVLDLAGYRIERVAEPGYTLGIYDLGGRLQPATVRALDREGAAFGAGVRRNDVILEMDGRPIRDRRALEEEMKWITDGNGEPILLVVGRGTDRLPLTIEPERFYKFRFTRKEPPLEASTAEGIVARKGGVEAGFSRF